MVNVIIGKSKRPQQTIEEWGTFSRRGLYVHGSESNPLVSPTSYLIHSGCGFNLLPSTQKHTKIALNDEVIKFQSSSYFQKQSPRFKERLERFISHGIYPSGLVVGGDDSRTPLPFAFNSIYNRSFNVRVSEEKGVSLKSNARGKSVDLIPSTIETRLHLNREREERPDSRTFTQKSVSSEELEGRNGLHEKTCEEQEKITLRDLEKINELYHKFCLKRNIRTLSNSRSSAGQINGLQSIKKNLVQQEIQSAAMFNQKKENSQSFDSVKRTINEALLCIGRLDSFLHDFRYVNFKRDNIEKIFKTIDETKIAGDTPDVNFGLSEKMNKEIFEPQDLELHLDTAFDSMEKEADKFYESIYGHGA